MKKLYAISLNYPFVYLALSIAMGLFLLYISSLPHSAIERSPYPQISDLFDALNHFIGFTIFNILLLSALVELLVRGAAERAPGLNPDENAYRAPALKGALRYMVPIGGAWGAACELIQIFISSRSFQAVDFAVNVLPALIVPLVSIKIIKEK